MTDLEHILDDCVQKMLDGEAAVEDLLRQHPAEAAALEPLLRAAARLQQGHMLRPSAAFKAKTREALKRHIRSQQRSTKEDGNAENDPASALSMGLS